MHPKMVLALALMLSVSHSAAYSDQTLERSDVIPPHGLTCEYQTQPMAVDTSVPRFSWRLPTGAMQTAYKVEVLKSQGELLWDSGQVTSDQSVLIPYAGPPLISDTSYQWRVKVWLTDGSVSGWSDRAAFETAKLSPEDFVARWIQPALQAQKTSLPTEQLSEVSLGRFVWFDFDYQDRKGVQGREWGLFRKTLILDARPEQAVLVAGGGYGVDEVWVNGTRIDDPQLGVGVADLLQEGSNELAVKVRWRKDRPGDAFFSLQTWKDGVPDAVYTADAGWMARAGQEGEDTGWREEAPVPAHGWAPAVEAAVARHQVDGAHTPRDTNHRARSLLWRRDFQVAPSIRSARLLISSLGWSEFRLNGKKVGDAALFPNWTDYHDRVEYAVHDVTGLLTNGPNTLGVITGNGWYSSGLMYGYSWGMTPAILAELRITYSDGTEEIITTDAQWRWSESSVTMNHIYFGEHNDARLEQSDWDQGHFDDAAWKPCLVDPWFQMHRMVAEQVEPIRATEERKPVSILPAPGNPEAWIVDFGQNFAGRCRITLRGLPSGQSVELLHAETLKADGSLDTANLRKAAVPDIYINRGAEEVTWEPLFTYHGFRYVQVTGIKGTLHPEDIVGVVLHSDVKRVGHVTTSNDLLNRFIENVDWSLRSNYMSVPTDCPQRTERLGWTGDVQAMAPSAIFLRDASRFFSKWNQDIIDSRGAPNQAPIPIDGQIGAPGWADAAVIMPWNLYLYYGDRQPMADAYPGMKRFVDHMLSEAEAMGSPYYYWKSGYGDHVSLDRPQREAFGTYYLHRSADLLSRMAGILGKTADAEQYAALLPRMAKTINDQRMNEETGYGRESQSEIAVPLAFGIVPEEKKAFIAGKLAERIEQDGRKPQTGFLGTPVLLPVLSDHGHHTLAGELLLREESPSWLHMVKAGATTVWERWNSDTEGPGMNSRNHFLFGCVTEWVFGYLAGIRPDAARPGFKHFLVKPMPIEGLDHLNARYESLYGEIRVSWERMDGRIALRVQVPGNTRATVCLPVQAETLAGEGRPSAPGWVYPELPSGIYSFMYTP